MYVSVGDSITRLFDVATHFDLMKNDCVTKARSEFKNMKKQTKVQINEKIMGFYGFASSGTAAIITLNVSFTDIRIPFVNASFTNLLMFHAAYNGLEKIDDIGNETWPSLKLLNLSHNALTNVKSKLFPYLKELEILDMSSNCFTHFHFERELYIHENLKKLYLQNNLIHKLDWPAMMPNLGHTLDFLDLSNNKLTHFECHSIAIRTLLLNNNSLSVISINYQGLMTFFNKWHLEAQHNQISYFSSTFNFAHLNLSYNELENLDDFVLDDFGGAKVLDLSHNNIKTVPLEDSDEYIEDMNYDYSSDEFRPEKPSKHGFRSPMPIFHVNLSYNQIGTLHSISGIDRFHNCKDLNLEGNNMANISYDKIRSEFKFLTHVNLKKNPLTKVDLNEIKFHNTTQFLGINFDYDDPDRKEEVKKVDPLIGLLLPLPPIAHLQHSTGLIELFPTTTEIPPSTTTQTTTKPANYNKTLTTTTPLTKVITTTTTESQKSTELPLSDNEAGSHQSIWIWITVIGVILVAPLMIYYVFLRNRFHRRTSVYTPRTYNEVENFL